MSGKYRQSIIIETVARMIFPFAILFALYVIIHGESGPGGGFQGGVIFATSIILLLIVFDISEAKKIFSEKLAIILASIGLFIYAGTGLASIFFDGYYLEYDVLPLSHPVEASEFGIILIEIGIGIAVMATMIVIFYAITTSEKEND